MTHKQQKAIAALIRSPTVEAAAEAAAVGYSTLRRWLKEDMDFQQEYQAALAGLMADAAAEAKKNLSPALGTLRGITEDVNQPGAVRVSAARSLLEFGLKLTEREDVLSRISELEDMLDGMESDGKT